MRTWTKIPTPSSYTQEPTEVLRALLFSLNLQSQDIAQDVAYSLSLSALQQSLIPSYAGQVHAYYTGTADEPLAYLLIGCSTDAHTDAATLSIVLDASIQPLPGQPLDDEVLQLYREALSYAATVAQTLQRNILQLGWDHHPNEPLDPAIVAMLTEAGFRLCHRQFQGELRDWSAITPQTLPQPLRIITENELTDNHPKQLAKLYNQAQAEIPHGELYQDLQPWDRQRLEQLWQLRHERGECYRAVGLMLEDQLVGISELLSDDGKHATQSLTMILPEFRRRGFAKMLKTELFARARATMPHLDRIFSTIDSGNKGILALQAGYGFQTRIASDYWETTTDRAGGNACDGRQ